MNKSSSLRSPHASNPARLGYRMPAEWEQHECTWLSWPHDVGTLRQVDSSRMLDFFCRLVEAISRDEAVHINVNDEEMEQTAWRRLKRRNVADRIHFHRIPTNYPWCRDYGAMVVTNRDNNSQYPTRIAIDWGFNAWGRTSMPFDRDNAAPRRMAHSIQIPCIAGGMVLEGGALAVNGRGDLLIAESCLHPNRNPDLTRRQIELRLAELLDVTNVIWLKGDIDGHMADGHIHRLARFVSRDQVVVVEERNSHDGNFQSLNENLKRLRDFPLTNGQSIQVVTLPMPSPVFCSGNRVPASYTSFYLTNHSVLVPQYRQPSDERAMEILDRLFPDRRVVGLDCSAVIGGLEAIHRLALPIPVA